MRRGVVFGVAAYSIWGLFPLYWPLLEPAGALEILAHRMVWSLVMMVILISAIRDWSRLRGLGAAAWLRVVAASALISVNWGVYIFAVNNGQVIEAALGYFINPLVSVVLGVVFFAERLQPLQWSAVVLGAAAVVVIAVRSDSFPWVALVLAGSFALYGLVKKVIGLPPTTSLTAEGMVLFLPAAGFLAALQIFGRSTLHGHGTGHVLLLLLSGVVTVVPLLAFAAAARALPLSVLGLLQYLTPVVQFLIGVLVVGEHMAPARWVGFGLVWVALCLLSVSGLRQVGRRRPVGPPAEPDSPGNVTGNAAGQDVIRRT